jgi:hypothetical protein
MLVCKSGGLLHHVQPERAKSYVVYCSRCFQELYHAFRVANTSVSRGSKWVNTGEVYGTGLLTSS